jgi:hypothetical protein
VTDLLLRDNLERESQRVALAPGAAERMFVRRERRDRRRRAATLVVGLALMGGVVALVVTAFPGRNRDRDVVTGPSSVAGTYETRLPSRDPDVTRLGVAGQFRLRLTEGGVLELNGPWDVDLPGPPVTFSVAGHELTTDFLVGHGCETNGTYRWTLAEGVFTLSPLDDPCEIRSVLLATGAWTETPPTPSPDALQGDWTAAYTCDQMVAAVERSAGTAANVEQWFRANAEMLGSPDPLDPCAAAPPPLASTLRFTGDRILIFDTGGTEGFDGRYELDGDVLTIRDPRTRNIDGEYQLRVQITPDALTFKLLGDGGNDAWFVSTWEVAPFVKRN